MKPNLILSLRKGICLSLVVAFTVMCFNTCIDDKYNLDKISRNYKINPVLFITIGSSEFTIDSVLSHLDSSQYIHTTDSGLFYVLYEKDLDFYKGEDKFIIPAHDSWNVSLPPLPLPFFPPGGNITLKIDTFHIPVSFGPDQLIDSMSIKKLLLSTRIRSSYGFPSNLTITFPNLVKNDVPYKQIYRITANNFDETQKLNAVGYFLKFTNVAPGISYITVKMELIMTGTQNAPVGAGSIDATISTDSLKYYALYGYAGQKELMNLTDSMNFGFLNNYITKKIEWKNPILTISANNSYIILPIRLTADSVQVYSKIDNRTYNVSLNPNPVNLKYPNRIGDAMRDTVVYSKLKNQSLYGAIESVPEYLKFHLRALANPDKITSQENIIIDTSSIKLHVNFNLPIWFRSGGFGTTDTMEFDMEKFAGNGLDSIQYMLFRLKSENGMPVDLKLQIYFVDDQYKVLDSLYHTSNNLILVGGALGPDDRVIQPTTKLTDATFLPQQLKAMKNTKKLLVKVFLNTAEWNSTNGRYVKFFSDYKFKLTFAVRFKAKFTGYY